jgi:hypothetical protein
MRQFAGGGARRSALATLALALGCSGSPAPEVADLAAPELDLAQPPDLMSRPPTDHPPFPTLTNHGGPILVAPEVWTVVWDGEEARGADASTFIDWMLASDYFTHGMAEYGVGAGVAKGVVKLPGAPPGDLLALSSVVEGIAAQPGFATNANTLFVMLLPESYSGTYGMTPVCQFAEGYHTATAIKNLPYVAAYACAHTITHVISHEVSEACSDPQLGVDTAWFSDAIPYVGEIGDLCYTLDAVYPPPSSDGGAAFASYRVNRIYSSKTAAIGKSDPCLPAPADQPFFGVGVMPPVLTIQTDSIGDGSATAALEPFAFGDVGTIRWTLAAAPKGVTFSAKAGKGRAGDSIPFTITVDHSFDSTGGSCSEGSCAVFLYSQSEDGHPGIGVFSFTVN